MFDKIYVESISKVKPDKELINRTKELMNNEVTEKRRIKSINFYKYATLAACIVVFVSVFTLFPRNVVRDIQVNNSSISSGSFEATDNINNDFSSSNNTGNLSDSSYSGAYFAPLAHGDIGFSSTVEANKKSNSFLEWIKEIIQWFYELLF